MNKKLTEKAGHTSEINKKTNKEKEWVENVISKSKQTSQKKWIIIIWINFISYVFKLKQKHCQEILWFFSFDFSKEPWKLEKTMRGIFSFNLCVFLYIAKSPTCKQEFFSVRRWTEEYFFWVYCCSTMDWCRYLNTSFNILWANLLFGMEIFIIFSSLFDRNLISF